MLTTITTGEIRIRDKTSDQDKDQRICIQARVQTRDNLVSLKYQDNLDSLRYQGSLDNLKFRDKLVSLKFLSSLDNLQYQISASILGKWEVRTWIPSHRKIHPKYCL